ncbi:MAG TPA: hypothetical protein VHB25_17675 [Gemmatimonadaceae bacterium]|nr:hypothetical protein [Gemmatimonadaceae bacterium]
MPFPKQNPIPFTKEGISKLNPEQTGCYGIYRTGRWIYVGRAECIRTRLLQHVNDTRSDIWKQNPTHVVAVVTQEHVEREKALIMEFKPCCNQKVG